MQYLMEGALRVVNQKTVLYRTVTMNDRAPSCPSRREARRQSRREAILDLAAPYFLEHGYAGTTMSGIAAALGGSKGTLWNHFPSKEVLFAAVIDRVTEAFRAELSLILNPRDGVETALTRFCGEFVRKVTSPEAIALHRLVVGEAHRFPEMGRIFYERAPRQTQRLLAAFLADAMAAGRLRADDPLMAARQLIAMCMLGSHQRRLMGVVDDVPAEAVEAEVERAMRTFLRAYAA
jgi:AcrR family transcriptional regulator